MPIPRMRHAAIVMIALLASCGPYARTGRGGSGTDTGASPTTRAISDTMDQLRGTLFITGSEPMTTVTLQREDAGAVTLLGDLEDELRRLSGATVAVYGAHTARPPTGGFDVRRYEVLFIDGQRPHVGTLVSRGDTTWLATESDTVRLAAVPEALRAQDSAKVWLIGPIMDGTLHVQSYGIIRAGNDTGK